MLNWQAQNNKTSRTLCIGTEQAAHLRDLKLICQPNPLLPALNPVGSF